MPLTIGDVLNLPGWGNDVQYAPAQDPSDLAVRLQREHPETLGLSAQARISWVWTAKPLTESGVEQIAAITLCNEKTRGLLFALGDVDPDTAPDYIAYCNVDEWVECSDREQVAAIHHCLRHVDQTDKGKWALAPHDLQEFREVVETHGLFSGRVERMAEAMQMHLPGLDRDPMLADGTSVTLSMPGTGQSVTMTGGQFEAATKRLTGMSRDEVAALVGDGDAGVIDGVNWTPHAAGGSQ